jgi:tRNA dimethylallyltransferase|tara:strand:- start:15724 stop:16503 length:780 start_codon:yes stop_codon:yes gene_type:complete
MSIGTAKPNEKELSQAEHYFIGSHSIVSPISAGEYERIALKKIEELHQEHKVIILTGGSGLFIDAVCKGLDDLPKVAPKIREELQIEFEEKGLLYLQEKLKKLDPEYFLICDQLNPHRLIRAIELCQTSGKKMAELRNKKTTVRPFDIIYIALNSERKELYEHINLRVDHMLKLGLESEARSLFSKRDLVALNTVGYSELFSYFSGEINIGEAVELIKRNSRRYAKRQITWFKRNPEYNWLHPNEIDKLISLSEKKMNE